MAPRAHRRLWGLIQGLTEFLPVSSSGHLVLLPAIFGFDEPGLAASVMLHLGTLVAVVAYYRRDLLRLLHLRSDPEARRILMLLAIGTVPAAIVGFTLDGPIEMVFSEPWLVAVAMMVTGGVLLFGTLVGRGLRRLPEGRWTDGLVVGLAQAFALLPGISRSGMTMTAGMAQGFQRRRGRPLRLPALHPGHRRRRSGRRHRPGPARRLLLGLAGGHGRGRRGGLPGHHLPDPGADPGGPCCPSRSTASAPGRPPTSWSDPPGPAGSEVHRAPGGHRPVEHLLGAAHGGGISLDPPQPGQVAQAGISQVGRGQVGRGEAQVGGTRSVRAHSAPSGPPRNRNRPPASGVKPSLTSSTSSPATE